MSYAKENCKFDDDVENGVRSFFDKYVVLVVSAHRCVIP